MASFLSGLTSGYAQTTLKKRQGQGKGGLLRKGSSSSTPNISGKTRAYDPSTGTVGSPTIPSFKKGGRVKKTGLARLHRGEQVLNRKQAKRYRRRSKSR